MGGEEGAVMVEALGEHVAAFIEVVAPPGGGVRGMECCRGCEPVGQGC
jgi:hypothetical protein